jgi:hypothetical protein
MQRVMNYGSFMQAYALKRTVESLGHSVKFTDFRKGTPRHLGEKVRTESSVEKLRKIPRILTDPSAFIQKRSFRRRHRECFEFKAWPALGIGRARDYDTNCDLMIIGSDEVFNYTQNHAFGYVPTLFGHGIEARKIIAYAASAGFATIADFENDGMAEVCSAGFKRFSNIGVRDQNTYDIVSRYARNPPVMTLDPTLIYDFTNDERPVSTMGEFLLIYAYEGRLDSPGEVTAVRDFAASHNLKVVSVGFYHHWCDENLLVEPFELLSLFRQASYVVTDTFHGSIFAIKSRRQFVSLLRGENRWGSNSNKLGFLLAQLGLQDRVARDSGQIGTHLDRIIDYDQVARTLAPLQEASMSFLVMELDSKVV